MYLYHVQIKINNTFLLEKDCVKNLGVGRGDLKHDILAPESSSLMLNTLVLRSRIKNFRMNWLWYLNDYNINFFKYIISIFHTIKCKNEEFVEWRMNYKSQTKQYFVKDLQSWQVLQKVLKNNWNCFPLQRLKTINSKKKFR